MVGTGEGQMSDPEHRGRRVGSLLRTPRSGRRVAAGEGARTTLTVLLFGVLGLAMGGCTEEEPIVLPPGLAARFDYSMPVRFEVPDPRSPEGQYEIYVNGPLHPNVWTVSLDACASTGSIVAYRWRVDGTPAGSRTACDSFVYDFPAEGRYAVSLTVEGSDGEVAVYAADVVVHDHLIFGIGDSYASGEGNPDVRVSATGAGAVAPTGTGLAGSQALAGAAWQSRRCHRSAYSGQVRAARLLEDADPHSSVTFVHLACSGARVHRGLLGEYLGVEPDGPPFPPQIDRVAELAAGHEIDALLVSIGGNDVNFSKIVEACILGEDCHVSPVGLDPQWQQQADLLCPLLGSFAAECTDYFDSIDATELDASTIFDVHSISEDVNGVDVRQDGIDDLPDGYRDLAREIGAVLRIDPAHVYLTEIPDVTRNDQGRRCGWDTLPFSLAAPLQLPWVTQAEMDWASRHVTAQLHSAMQAAAAELGWTFVTGISARFERHGYCALDSWLVRLQDTFLIQGDSYGALHPNVAGHGVYATEIARALVK